MQTSTFMKILAPLLVAAAIVAGCGGGGGSSAMNNPQNPGSQPPLGTAMLNGAPGFVNANGFTVYVFDGDLGSPGQSTCNNACAQVWPAIAPPGGSMPSGWSTITRQNGSSQLTYNGRPLYTYTGDTQPGQWNGDGISSFGATWHIARPASSSPGPSPMPSPTSMPSY